MWPVTSTEVEWDAEEILGLRSKNPHPIDDRIKFNTANHVYGVVTPEGVIAGAPLMSVSGVIDSIKPPFPQTAILRCIGAKHVPIARRIAAAAETATDFDTARREVFAQVANDKSGERAKLKELANLEKYAEDHAVFADPQRRAVVVADLVERRTKKGEVKGVTDEDVFAEIVRQRWSSNDAAALGTALHRRIELHLNDATPTDVVYEPCAAWNQFGNFRKDHSHIVWHRTEFRLCDLEHMLTGTVDASSVREVDESGKVVAVDLWDWKRSKDIRDAAKADTDVGKLRSPLDDLENTKINCYTLQLNLYAHMLEKVCGIRVVDLHLVCLHPNQENYDKIRCERWHDRTRAVLDFRAAQLVRLRATLPNLRPLTFAEIDECRPGGVKPVRGPMDAFVARAPSADRKRARDAACDPDTDRERARDAVSDLVVGPLDTSVAPVVRSKHFPVAIGPRHTSSAIERRDAAVEAERVAREKYEAGTGTMQDLLRVAAESMWAQAMCEGWGS
jgi:hypothetical protein